MIQGGKTQFITFCPENEVSHQHKVSSYKNEMKTNIYTQSKTLTRDRTDKKNYLTHFYVAKYLCQTWDDS